MNRRDTLVALLALGVAPVTVKAQQPARKLYRIGVLSHYIPRDQFVAIPAALRRLGYEEGLNIAFEYRFAEGKEEGLPALAADLVASKVDVIVAFLNPEILAAKQATSTVPIVMCLALTPVESGLVGSLSHPQGNVTGTTVEDPETAGKKLEILRDAVPSIKRVIALWEPDFPGMDAYRGATERAAKAMGIRLTLLPGRTLEEIERAFVLIARERPDGIFVVSTGAIVTHQARIIEFAARQRLPAIFTEKRPVLAGGLMSYSADIGSIMQRSAAFIDRILKGDKPADLPVEQPTKFELVINLKTAKSLGIKIPQSLLLSATEVIE